MNDIYEKLLQSGCIEKEDYLQKKSRMEAINGIRTSFLQELEDKNKDRTMHLKQLHEEEVQLIAEIKRLIKTSEFKRIYLSNDKKENIRSYVEKLEANWIECTKGLEALSEIKRYVEMEIHKQKQADQQQLNQIKNQVGTKIWEDFHHHFESQEFLSLL